MGKWIDRWVGWFLVIAALYAVFFRAFRRASIASGLVFFCAVLIHRGTHRRIPRPKMSSRQAEAILAQWICGDESDAQSQIEALIGGNLPVIYLPKAPMSALSPADLFGVWKANRGTPAVAAAALCRAEQSAKIFVQNYTNPKIEIYDSARLISMIRTSSLTPPAHPTVRPFRNRLSLRALCGQCSWKRRAASGIFFLLVYLRLGNFAYLALGIGSLFLAGAALRLSH